MSPEVISLIGILVALFLFAYLSFKGMPLIFTAPALVVVIWLFSAMGGSGKDIMTVFKPFSEGTANLIKNFFLLFIMSALFGKIVTDTGIAYTIGGRYAEAVRRAAPENQKFLAICLVPFANAILTYAGVSLYVVTFTAVAIARDLFKELDVPWHLYALAMVGSATFSATCLPGSPAVQNLLPMQYFGTTAMAAPVLSMVLSICSILLGLAYMKYALRKTQKAGEGFLPTGALIAEVEMNANKGQEYVPLWAAVGCIFIPIVLMNACKLPAVVALGITNIVLIIAFYKRFTVKKLKDTLGQGVLTGVMPLVGLAAVIGFGQVITAQPGFKIIYAGLRSIPAPDYVQMVLMVIVTGFLLGSGIGGMNVTLEAMGKDLMAHSSVSPEVLHRLSCVGSTATTSPHSGGICNSMLVARLNHGQSYIHYFMIGTVNCAILSAIALVLVGLGLTF